MDKKACNLTVNDYKSRVGIRLSGHSQQAKGLMKVRVENLAAGELVDGWHRSFGFPNNAFLSKILADTGAFVRADWRRHLLKAYGSPDTIKLAADLIQDELRHLLSREYTHKLQPQSVRFFLRLGVATLQEIYGDEAATLDISNREITVTEQARDMLEDLIRQSLSIQHNPSSSLEQDCPICFDVIASPFKLVCGHVYCTGCARHAIASAANSGESPLVCVAADGQCGAPIPIPTIRKFLSLAAYDRYLEAVVTSHIERNPGQFVYCKTADCIQIYSPTGEGATPRTLQCPSCFVETCSSCNDNPHEGTTCENNKLRKDPAEQERLNDQWLVQMGGRVKNRPQCRVMIEKTEGCNHMSCR